MASTTNCDLLNDKNGMFICHERGKNSGSPTGIKSMASQMSLSIQILAVPRMDNMIQQTNYFAVDSVVGLLNTYHWIVKQ